MAGQVASYSVSLSPPYVRRPWKVRWYGTYCRPSLEVMTGRAAKLSPDGPVPVVQTTDEQPNLLLIRVTYRVRANHAIGNLVYPFYVIPREEG